MVKKLQVLIGGDWKWVFARNETKANPITTPNRTKALDFYAKDYFENHYGNHKFRLR